jgi:hypothetical protein
LVLGAGALLACPAGLRAADVKSADATSQPSEGRDSLTVSYGCKFRGTAIRVVVHKDGKDLELTRDKVSAVALTPDKVTLAGDIPCDCTLVAVRFSTATDPAHVALFKRKDITAIGLGFQAAEGGFSRERSSDEVDKDLLKTNTDLLASHLAAGKDATKKSLAAIIADYAPKLTTPQDKFNDANAKYQAAGASAANAQNAVNAAANQAAHTGGSAHWWAVNEQRAAQRTYDKAAKDATSAQKDLNEASAALQTLTTQRAADMARVTSQSGAAEAALREVSTMHATVLFFGGTLTAADMEANYTAEAAPPPAAKPDPDPAPAPPAKKGRNSN